VKLLSLQSRARARLSTKLWFPPRLPLSDARHREGGHDNGQSVFHRDNKPKKSRTVFARLATERRHRKLMHACTRTHARTHARTPRTWAQHSFIRYLARESNRRPHRRPQHLPRGANRSEAGALSSSWGGGLKMPDQRVFSRVVKSAQAPPSST